MMYLCATVFEASYAITWEQCSATDIFVGDSVIPNSINIVKIEASFPDHSPPLFQRWINSCCWLLRYGSGRTHTWDQLLDYPLAIGPAVSKYSNGLYYRSGLHASWTKPTLTSIIINRWARSEFWTQASSVFFLLDVNISSAKSFGCAHY